MSAPFETLEDRLLRGGIAPRHVKRYLRELNEHLADLTEAQSALGFAGEDADLRARAALGPGAELAGAMLKQRDFRALSARAPWLVFGIAPVFLVLLAFVLTALLIAATAWASGLLGRDGDLAAIAPAWFQTCSQMTAQIATFLLPLLIASLLVLLAERQRMPMVWPLLGIAMIVTCGIQMCAQIAPPGQRGFSIGLGTTILPLPQAIGGGGLHFEGLTVLAQCAVALLPLGWLLLRRRAIRISP